MSDNIWAKKPFEEDEDAGQPDPSMGLGMDSGLDEDALGQIPSAPPRRANPVPMPANPAPRAQPAAAPEAQPAAEPLNNVDAFTDRIQSGVKDFTDRINGSNIAEQAASRVDAFTDRINSTNLADRAASGAVPETVNPNAHFGMGQGPDKHVESVGDNQDFVGNGNMAAQQQFEDAVTNVVMSLYQELFWQNFPEELTGLCYYHGGTISDIEDGQMATIERNDAGDHCIRAFWGPGGGLRVKGTPGYGKGVFSRGFTRTNVDDDWWGDNGPTDPDDDDHDPANRGNYSTDESESTLQAWLPCWDYPRVY